MALHAGEQPRRRPSVWVKILASVMAGDTTCLYAGWRKSQYYQREKHQSGDEFNLTLWTMDHTALVQRRAAELRAEGWTVTLEDQNRICLRGKFADLAGKPDILAVREGCVLVVDAKTGRSRNTDIVQVLLYLWMLQRARKDLAGLRFVGEVIYRDAAQTVVDGWTPERLTQVETYMRTFAAQQQPAPSPSERECRMCDLAGCEARISDSDGMVGDAGGVF